MGEGKTARLSVFKGREAKLNRAIFQTLALKGPQTIYDIHKQVRTYRGLKQTKYASVNKRVRSLDQSAYIKKVSIRKTKAGLEAVTYDLTAKAYLAVLLRSIALDQLLVQLDENSGKRILADIVEAISTQVVL